MVFVNYISTIWLLILRVVAQVLWYIYTPRIVYGWDGVRFDWGWLGCFGLCGVDENK